MTQIGSRTQFDVIQVARFIAAALVVVTHTTFYFHERVTSFPVWHLGEIGVPVFFVISGIVIVLSSARLGLGKVAARTFLLNRFSRIVPLYWLASFLKIAIAIALPGAVLHNHFDLIYALKSLAFIPAYNLDGQVRPIHGVGWTLLHEAYFYLLFALGFFFRVNPGWFASTIILACVATRAAWPEGVAASEIATSPNNIYFVIGVAIGHFIRLRMHSASARLGLYPLALLMGMLIYHFLTAGTPALPGNDFRVYVVGLLIATFPFVRVTGRAGLFSRLGDSSYSLYLFHPFLAPAIVTLLRSVGVLNPWVSLPSAVVTSIVAAHAIHLWIEMPMVTRIRHLLKLQKGPVTG